MTASRLRPAARRTGPWRGAYRLLGVEDQLWRDEFDAGHRWSGRLAYEFMGPLLEKGRRRPGIGRYGESFPEVASKENEPHHPWHGL